MYEIMLFSGGVYKFDELAETVEDIGGLVLKKDHFHRIRSTSYVGEEIQVMIIVPEKDKGLIKSLSKDIKGNIENLELDDSERNNILTCLSIYDVLSQSDSWISMEAIEDSIECPCPAQLCQNKDAESCVHDELDETLDKLCNAEIVDSRKKDEQTKYRLLDDDEKE